MMVRIAYVEVCNLAYGSPSMMDLRIRCALSDGVEGLLALWTCLGERHRPHCTWWTVVVIPFGEPRQTVTLE